MVTRVVDLPLLVLAVAAAAGATVGTAVVTVAWATISGLPAVTVATLMLLPLLAASSSAVAVMLSPRPARGAAAPGRLRAGP
jgi:hypothetical protein